MDERIDTAARPSKCTAGELRKVGVTLVSVDRLLLQCNQCGQQWSPDLGRGGRLPRGYWHCPQGCNVPKGEERDGELLDESRCFPCTVAGVPEGRVAMTKNSVLKGLAEWCLGELPAGHPGSALRGPQGWRGVCDQWRNERTRDESETLANPWCRIPPSGPIFRFVRRAIIVLNLARIQVHIDQLRDWFAFVVLGRQFRTLHEIAAWRDHYYVVRLIFLVAMVWFVDVSGTLLRGFLLVLSVLLLVDMIVGVAGSALVWSDLSVSHERSFIGLIVSYVSMIAAFAGYYRACDCLSARAPTAIEALYFSAVTATTTGYGDIRPVDCGWLCTLSVSCETCQSARNLGMFLVMCQAAIAVLFMVVLIGIFMGRAYGK